MNACPPRNPQRHCLLPFEAEPQAVGRLRHTVGLQLAAWGASALSDAALLVVSELATNVIRHVGNGTPAALLMEASGSGLRVELHDTSRTMPRCELAGQDDECGRGLALVAAVSARWFAVATPGGKAVCCELIGPVAARHYNVRAARGSEAVESYALRRNAPQGRLIGSGPAVRATVTDLITDLMHWLAAAGQDPDTVLDHAQTRFEAENP